MKQETYISNNGIHYISNKKQRESMRQFFNVIINGEVLPFPTDGILTMTIKYLDNQSFDIKINPIKGDLSVFEENDYNDEYWEQLDRLTSEQKIIKIKEIESKWSNDESAMYECKSGVIWRQDMAIIERLKNQLNND